MCLNLWSLFSQEDSPQVRDVQGGIAKIISMRKNIWKIPPCPAKPYPLSTELSSAANF